MNENQTLQLGVVAKDRITGFVGTITGYCQYLTGCHQVLLVPKVSDDGALPESHWFDVDRCEVISDGPWHPETPQKRPGGDREAPKR